MLSMIGILCNNQNRNSNYLLLSQNNKVETFNQLPKELNYKILILDIKLKFSDNNKYDTTPLLDICDKLSVKGYNGVVLINVYEPNVCLNISKMSKLNVCNFKIYPLKDNIHITIGNSTCTDKQLHYVEDIFLKSLPKTRITLCKANELEIGDMVFSNYCLQNNLFMKKMEMLCEHCNCDFNIVNKIINTNDLDNKIDTNNSSQIFENFLNNLKL